MSDSLVDLIRQVKNEARRIRDLPEVLERELWSLGYPDGKECTPSDRLVHIHEIQVNLTLIEG